MTESRKADLRRLAACLRRFLSRAALTALVALPASMPLAARAQTPVSSASSLSTEIEAKLKQRGTLILRDATLIETLFAIKENWKINIVVDNDVKGAINGAYTNAPLHEILDSILLPHGYGYRAIGDSLVVLKLNDIGAMKPLFSTQMIPLANVPPEEVLKVIEFMLSPHGKAHAVPTSKSLVVMDFPDRIELIKERIRELDVAAARIDAGIPVDRPPALDSGGTSPVTTGARSLFDMLLRGGGAGGTPSDSSSADDDTSTAPADQDPQSGARPTPPLAVPPSRTGSGPSAVEASPSDQNGGASFGAAESSEPQLDVAFYTPQYIRAPAITEALSKLVSEYGQVSVIAEENRIVAVDRPEYLRRITAAIERLDVPRSQVRIAAMIYDCSLEDSERLGINWSHTVKGNNLDADGNAQDQFSVRSITLQPPSPDAINGAMTLTSLGSNLDMTSVVHALNSSKTSKLLADPTVVVLDQESAKIAIVTEIPYQQLTESALGGSIGTTAFREAGVTLEVTPRIARDGTINLVVTPQFSVLTGFTETDNQPIIARREATTVVRVCDNQTLVIGGLRQKSAVRDRSGIPYLSDLKFVGHLFRYRSDELRESELLVFITPAIITPQTFGTIREQQAYDNSVCQLHGVRQCLECCNQDRDKAIYTNQDFGYGSVIYEVPAADPQALPSSVPPPAPPAVPPQVPPGIDESETSPHVTGGPPARAISHRYPSQHPAFSSRRDARAPSTVNRAPEVTTRPAEPTVARRPAVSQRSAPVTTPVQAPTRVVLTDEPDTNRPRPAVQGPVVDFAAQAQAARHVPASVALPAEPASPAQRSAGLRPAIQAQPAVPTQRVQRPEQPSQASPPKSSRRRPAQPRSAGSTTRSSSAPREALLPRLARQLTAEPKAADPETTPAAAPQPTSAAPADTKPQQDPAKESSSSLKTFFKL